MVNVQWFSLAADVHLDTSHWNNYWPLGYNIGLFFYGQIKSGVELQYTTLHNESISINKPGLNLHFAQYSSVCNKAAIKSEKKQNKANNKQRVLPLPDY